VAKRPTTSHARHAERRDDVAHAPQVLVATIPALIGRVAPLLLFAGSVRHVTIAEEACMKSIMGIALAILLALSVAGAYAADTAGKVQSIDRDERMIVLDDGTKLWIAEGVPMDNLKEGAQVQASYEERDGKNVVTDLKVSE
jgi:Cu/Ag efflux protein CusF